MQHLPDTLRGVSPPGKYNDGDTRFTYLGHWDPGRGFDDAFGGTVSFTDDKSAEIRFEFNGSAFIYGFTRAFNRGRGQIWIDGKAVDVLDQYSPRIEWQAQQKYAVDRPGRHSVAIRVTGEKDSQVQRSLRRPRLPHSRALTAIAALR